MKKLSKRCLSITLAVLLAFTLIPASAFAAGSNDEPVLTGLSRSGIGSAVIDNSNKTATFTIPYSYATTIDFDSGLNRAFDTSTYTSVIISFPPGGSTISSSGGSITMNVSYQYIADVNSADPAISSNPPSYSTNYTLIVQKAARVEPTFGGTVTKSGVGFDSIPISFSDFSAMYTVNDGPAIGSISISGADPSFGSLKLNGADLTSTTKITSSSSQNLCFIPTVSSPDTWPYKVTAYDASNKLIDRDNDGVGDEVTLNITVSPASPTVLKVTTQEDVSRAISFAEFNAISLKVTGKDITTVKFSSLPHPTSQGNLYSGSTLVAAGVAYPATSITFTPYKDYYGSFSLGYTAAVSGNDNAYTSSITFTVNDVPDATVGVISYKTNENEAKTFNTSDFYTVCVNYTKTALQYVQFSLPKSSYGTLYYNYTSSSNYGSLVKASTAYYYNTSPSISSVTFVPADDYSGSFNLSYTALDATNKTYSGVVTITVSDTNDVSTINYSTKENQEVKFDEYDFNKVSKAGSKGTLSYVKFTLPSTSEGRLYENYSASSQAKIDASTKYYYDDNPSISDVTFVPASGYEGTFYITYSGRGASGSFTGKIKMVVGTGSTTSTTITYKTDLNKAVTFDDDDFYDICKNQTKEKLNYVKFSLPSSSQGILYYNYDTSNSKQTEVSASTKYYYSSSDYLKKVTFVPKSNYSGTVTIDYTAYSDAGTKQNGTVKITVGSGSTTASDINYTTKQNTNFQLIVSDFKTACQKAVGDDLDYIKFTLPSSSYGVFYTDYTSANSYTTKVASSTKYYAYSSPRISSITLVPAKDYTGTFAIAYTGYDEDGESFTGKINVTVKGTAVVPVTPVATSAYFSDVDSNYSWAATYIDSLYKAGYVAGTGAKKFNPASKIKRGDFILMLYRALGFKSTSASTNFSDVSKSSYYYEAIAAAKALGIAEGTDGKFKPEATLTRQDAMVLVNRALTATGTVLPSGTASNLAAYKDSSNISSYAYNSVSTLVKAGIINGTASKINPKSTVSRAEMAVILYRVVN
ncbi:MAG: S-layer homology domain-containing protein [Eubacteriales bacterium]|nr:S-layer homology domain-containing protein [Eubacteriales bacterium]